MSHGDEGSLISKIYNVHKFDLGNDGFLDYSGVEIQLE